MGIQGRSSAREASDMGDEVVRLRWRDWARSVLAAEDAWMILDLETTGTAINDIIEFAAVTPSGQTLVSQLVRPSSPISPFVVALTGIRPAMVATMPYFAQLFPTRFAPHLAARKLLVYNVGFDVPVLRKSITRHCRQTWEPVESACLMWAYARYRGERHPEGHPTPGRLKIHSLERACHQMGVPYTSGHRALYDCQVSAALLQAMAR